MNLTLEKLHRLRENALAFGISIIADSNSEDEYYLLHYELFEISHSESIWAMYIGDKTLHVQPYALNVSFFNKFPATNSHCKTLYLFGGTNITSICSICKVILKMGLVVDTLDLTFLNKTFRRLSLMEAFYSCDCNIIGLDNLFSKHITNLERAFYKIITDKIDINCDTFEIENVMCANSMFRESRIKYLDAALLSKLPKYCECYDLFYGSHIDELHLHNIKDNEKYTIMFDNGTIINRLYAPKRVYNLIRKYINNGTKYIEVE